VEAGQHLAARRYPHVCRENGLCLLGRGNCRMTVVGATSSIGRQLARRSSPLAKGDRRSRRRKQWPTVMRARAPAPLTRADTVLGLVA